MQSPQAATSARSITGAITCEAPKEGLCRCKADRRPLGWCRKRGFDSSVADMFVLWQYPDTAGMTVSCRRSEDRPLQGHGLRPIALLPVSKPAATAVYRLLG